MSHGCSKSGGHCLSNVLNLLQASPRLSSGLCLNFWTCFFTFMVLVSGKNSFINNLWSWGQERKWWLSWLSGYLNASPITENENYFNRMTWYAPKRALERVGFGLNCDVFMPVYGQFMKEKLWCAHSCKTLPFVVFQSNSRRTKEGPRPKEEATKKRSGRGRLHAASTGGTIPVWVHAWSPRWGHHYGRNCEIGLVEAIWSKPQHILGDPYFEALISPSSLGGFSLSLSFQILGRK